MHSIDLWLLLIFESDSGLLGSWGVDLFLDFCPEDFTASTPLEPSGLKITLIISTNINNNQRLIKFTCSRSRKMVNLQESGVLKYYGAILSPMV